MYKTIFLGNSQFCMPTLEKLNELTNIQAVITGEDKIITKHSNSINKPLPKIFAEQENIPVYQPSNIKDQNFINTIRNYNPDFMVIISYGKILPVELFSIPSMGTFNLHASILPKYRGASPLQAALLNNNSITGITLQKINEKMDDGNIFWVKNYTITNNEVFPTLYTNMSYCAAQTLEEFIDYLQKEKKLPEAKKQIGEISFCGKILKQDGQISFIENTAQEIFNKYRAYYTWPQIFTTINNKNIKLEEIELITDFSTEISSQPGMVIKANKEGLWLQTRSGMISIKKVKPENKKSQDFVSFINGYNIKQGDILC